MKASIYFIENELVVGASSGLLRDFIGTALGLLREFPKKSRTWYDRGMAQAQLMPEECIVVFQFPTPIFAR